MNIYASAKELQSLITNNSERLSEDVIADYLLKFGTDCQIETLDRLAGEIQSQATIQLKLNRIDQISEGGGE